MVDLHPTRPIRTSDPLLICEGRDDQQFLAGVLSRLGVNIYQAGGKDSVPTLRTLWQPALYILDRDFEYTYEKASHNLALTTKTFAHYWPYHCVENYLLHADWVVSALKELKPKSSFSVSQIDDSMMTIAKKLCIDHAGRHSIEMMKKSVMPSPLIYQPIIDKKFIKGGAEASNQSTWETYLLSQAALLRQKGDELYKNPQMADKKVIELFNNHLVQYQQWAEDLTVIRVHFSGKRLFQMLTVSLKMTLPWSALRDETIRQAVEYSFSITELLSNDPRLGDFGKLASKILAQPV